MITAFSIIILTNQKDTTPNGVIASVNDHFIYQAELDEQIKRLTTFYTSNQQSYDQATLQRDALARLVEQQIIQSFAASRGLAVSDQDVLSYFNQRSSSTGGEAALLEFVAKSYGINKEQYMQVLQYDLLVESVQKNINQNYSDWLKTQKQTAIIQYHDSAQK